MVGSMFWKAFLGGCALSFVLLQSPDGNAQSANAQPISINAIARHPAMQSVVLSPDGQHIAALISRPDQRWPVIAIWRVDDLARAPVLVPSREMRPRNLAFLGNDRLMFFADQPIEFGALRSFTVQAVVMDLEGRDFSQPLGGALGAGHSESARRAGVTFNILRAGNLENPNEYIISVGDPNTGDIDIIALDVATMRTSQVTSTGTSASYSYADVRDGELLIRTNLRSEAGNWRAITEVRNRATGNWEEHEALSFFLRDRQAVDGLGFYDEDPNKLYVSTARGSDHRAIYLYDVVTRRWDEEPAFATANYDVVGMTPDIDYGAGSLTGPRSFIVEGPDRREIFVDSYWSAVQRSLQARFSDKQVSITPARQREGFAVVTVSSPRHPPSYYLLKNGRELQMLGQSRPWIEPESLGEMSLVQFTARDGLVIPTFLTLPPGYDRSRGRIPVVVHPHGGPWARDYLGWDSSGWTQFLATRGYAVIQPQFRGSDGWGMALWRAGDREWGLRMSDDNDDALAWLVEQGIGDPQRAAIFGYSYGGFAAIAASVREQSPYRCALSGAGVSDLQRLGNLWGANRVQRQYQGWTVDGMNPIRHVENANIPILLYHGTHDRQADTVHSRTFVDAMRSARKQVVYHEIRNMWHQLPWWPEWHTETLGLIENWLAGPDCFGASRAS
jgi:dipeptidyl aminopeptidase/acylaminoacyl peptidase